MVCRFYFFKLLIALRFTMRIEFYQLKNTAMSLHFRFIIVFLFFSQVLNAQTFNGIILDESEEGIEWATVTLLSASDSTLLDATNSDESGSFTFTNIEEEKFIINISFMGYETIEELLENKGNDLVTFKMKVSENILNEVLVEGTRPRTYYRNGKLVYDLNGTNGFADSGIELLENVPLVKLDKDDNILLRGNLVKVLIDGKDLNLKGEELKSYLKSLKSDQISKVEVITNPSSKWEAEGSGGMVNIVLKERKKGFHNNVMTYAGYGKYAKIGAGISTTYSNARVGLSASFYPSWNKSENVLTIDRENLSDGTLLTQKNVWTPVSKYFPASFSLNYNIDDNNSISTFFKNGISHSSETNETISDMNRAEISNEFDLFQESDDTWNRKTYGINYDSKLDTLGEIISLEYLGINALNDVSHSQSTEVIENGIQKHFNIISANKYKYNINSLKIDYSQPLSEKTHFETGIKYSKINSKSKLSYDFDENAKEYIFLEIIDNDFTYKENIMAGYFDFNSNWNKISFRAGLRTEYTLLNTLLETEGNSEEYKTKYIDFFPSTNISYQINEKQTLSLSYNRRLNRPYYKNLNPAIEFLDQYSYSRGNPYLTPEYSNSFELTYQREPIVASLYANTGKGTISDVVNQDDSNSVIISLPDNLTKSKRVGLDINTNLLLFKKINCDMGVSASYNTSKYFQGNLELNQEAYDVNFSLNLTYPISKHFKFNVSGVYGTPSQYGLYRMNQYYGINSYISFNKNNITLSLKMSDILNSRNWDSNINYGNTNIHWLNKWESRRVYLRLNYSFGNEKTKNKGKYKKSTYLEEGNRI